MIAGLLKRLDRLELSKVSRALDHLRDVPRAAFCVLQADATAADAAERLAQAQAELDDLRTRGVPDPMLIVIQGVRPGDVERDPGRGVE